jgi:hypothetical protein
MVGNDARSDALGSGRYALVAPRRQPPNPIGAVRTDQQSAMQQGCSRKINCKRVKIGGRKT